MNRDGEWAVRHRAETAADMKEERNAPAGQAGSSFSLSRGLRSLTGSFEALTACREPLALVQAMLPALGDAVGADEVRGWLFSGPVSKSKAACMWSRLGGSVVENEAHRLPTGLTLDHLWRAAPVTNDERSTRWGASSQGQPVRASVLVVAGTDGVAALECTWQQRPATEQDLGVVLEAAAGHVAAALRCLDIGTRRAQAVISQMDTLMAASGDAMIVSGSAGTIMSWNPAAERIFGWSAQEAIGQPLTLVVPKDSQPAHRSGFARASATGMSVLDGQLVEVQGLRRDGSLVPIELGISSWETESGRFFGAVLRDITARRAAQAVSSQEALLLETTLALQCSITDAGNDTRAVYQLIVEYAEQICRAQGSVLELLDGDDLVYVAASGSAAQQIGMRISSIGSLSGLAATTGSVQVCRDAQTDARVNRAACERIGLRSMVIVPLVHDGVTRGALKVFSPVPDAFGEREIASLRVSVGFLASTMHRLADFTAQISQDELTGLANRRAFAEQLGRALEQRGTDGGDVAVLFCDMDGLKVVNDELGHAAGDEALRAVAALVKGTVRPEDLVARLGGDEFVVLCRHTPTREIAERIRSRVYERFANACIALNGEKRSLRVSIGLATTHATLTTPDALLACADADMYAHKQARKRTVHAEAVALAALEKSF